MAKYIRSYAQTSKIDRGQVYQVVNSGFKDAIRFVPMFGRNAGYAGCIDVPKTVYHHYVEVIDFIEVQPLLRSADNSLHFVHDTLGTSNLVNWINATTSGIMQAEDLLHFESCDPSYPE